MGCHLQYLEICVDRKTMACNPNFEWARASKPNGPHKVAALVVCWSSGVVGLGGSLVV